MTAPAVLYAKRGLGRAFLTGIIALLGIVIAFVGWLLLFVQTWAGIAVVAVGLATTGIAEAASRRFRLVTTRGLRWQRSFHTDVLDWHAVRLGTHAPPGTDPKANDRILVHRPDGSVVEWPEPRTHDDCLRTLQWWHRVQVDFPRGDFRLVPGLRMLGPATVPHRVHNPVRRGWHVAAVLPLAAAVVVFLVLGLAAAANGDLEVATAFALAAGVFAIGLGAGIRNATSAVRVEADRFVHRRSLSWRSVPREAVVGAYGFTRPSRITFAGFIAISAIASIFEQGGIDDSPNDRLVPVLLLRDGSSVMLTALTTRSGARLHSMLDELMA